MKRIFPLNFGLILLIAAACSPHTNETEAPNTTIKFEPKLEDKVLNLESVAENPPGIWFQTGNKYPVDGDSFFEMTESLMEMTEYTDNKVFSQEAHLLLKDFYRNSSNYTQATARQSLYLDAALGEKKSILIKLLTEKREELGDSLKLIKVVFSSLESESQEIFNGDSIPRLAQQVKDFINITLLRLKNTNVSPDVVAAYHEELQLHYQTVIDEFVKQMSQVAETRSPKENLNSIRVILKLPLTRETLDVIEGQLNDGSKIIDGVEKITDAQQALEVIVDVWTILDSEQQKRYFEPLNKDLYTYLQNADSETLRKIRNGSYDPRIAIARYWYIIPALEKYGIKKIQKELSTSVNEYLLKSIYEQLKVQLQSFPHIIGDIVQSAVNERISDLNHYLDGSNYGDFFAEKSAVWGEKVLFAGQKNIPGLERSRFRLSAKENGNYQILPDTLVSRKVVSSSTMGTSMSAAVKRLVGITEYEGISTTSPEYYKLVMQLLNKIPALGGFKKIDDQLYPSFHVQLGVADPFYKLMDIKEQIKSTDTFAVPDYISVNPPFQFNKLETSRRYKLNFSVQGQAQLLKGLSLTAQYFADWKVNGFDDQMSQFVLGNLMPNVPQELENEALFPKDKLYEYSLGISANILKNLVRSESNLILVTHSGREIGGNEIESALNDANDVPLYAAIVDRGMIGQDKHVSAAALSRFIIALGEFLKSVEGVENSKSTLIQETQNGGKPILNLLKSEIKKVRVLTLLFANFLTNKMRGEDGLIYSNYSLQKMQPVGSIRFLEDQALSIKALLVSADILGMQGLLGTAYDIYFAMNHRFFNEELGFYTNTDKSIQLPYPTVSVQVLSALGRLATIEPDYSHGQLNKILKTYGPLIRR